MTFLAWLLMSSFSISDFSISIISGSRGLVSFSSIFASLRGLVVGVRPCDIFSTLSGSNAVFQTLGQSQK